MLLQQPIPTVPVRRRRGRPTCFTIAPVAPSYVAQMPAQAVSLSTEQAQFAAELVHRINDVRASATHQRQLRNAHNRKLRALCAEALELSDLAQTALALLTLAQAHTSQAEAQAAARLEAESDWVDAAEWSEASMQSDALEHITPQAF